LPQPLKDGFTGIVGIVEGALDGSIDTSPVGAALPWLMPPAAFVAEPVPLGPSFWLPPFCTNPGPVPLVPAPPSDPSTHLLPDPEMPKFVILTLAGVAAREIDAMIESPLLLFEFGGNKPTPGMTGESVAWTGFPGWVPWKPV
jgi:hypothetical protein